MTWIKLDDRSVRHPKIAGLSDRGFRWWVRSLCYCSEFLTDGRLPAIFLADVPRAVVAELETAGLWVAGTVHDYLTYQRSRVEVERERDRNRRRRPGGTAGRTAGTPACSTAGSTAGVPRPDSREQSTDPPIAPRRGARRLPKVVQMQVPSQTELDRQAEAVAAQLAAAIARERAS